MGSFPVIVPPSPGLLCAIGDLVADFRDEFAQTHIRLVADAAGDEVAGILDELGEQAKAWLDGEGHRRGRAADRLRRRHALPPAGLRDPGRARPGEVRGNGLGDLEERFNALHEQLYGFRMPGTALGDRQPARGRLRRRAEARAAGRRARLAGRVGRRRRRARDRSSTASACRRRSTTARGWSPARLLEGPAIVTEFDSTTVVLPGYRAEVDSNFNILITPSAVSERRRWQSTEELADRRDPGRRGRPRHARHHRGRAEERPLRDGRRALPLGDEPGHPRAARRVPDDHRPARPHGRRASSAPTSTR